MSNMFLSFEASSCAKNIFQTVFELRERIDSNQHTFLGHLFLRRNVFGARHTGQWAHQELPVCSVLSTTDGE